MLPGMLAQRRDLDFHNCEFFLAKHDVVSVVTGKDVLGDFKAYAIRSNQSSRDALLSSEPRATPLLALESLHMKSCEAVQQFITTNGFSFPPDPKKTRFEDDDDDEDDEDDEEDGNDDDDIASIFSNLLSDRPVLPPVAMPYKKRSDGEVKMTPASSAVPVTHGREVRDERSNNIGRPRTNPPPPPPPPGRQSPEGFIFQNVKPPYTLSQTEELVMELMNGPLPNNFPRTSGPPPPPPPPSGYSSAAQAQAQAPKPPSAIPSWPPVPRGMSVPPPGNYSPANARSIPRQAHNYPPMGPSPARNGSGSGSGGPMVHNARMYDIALTIRWLGHGEARVLASCKASVQALKSTAVTYVTRHASAFDKEGSPPNRNNPMWTGAVRLRRASMRSLHDEEYDLNMELYQEDDLTRFCSGRGMPKFEVEVEDQKEEGI
ncbi:hypothetical protein Daesc_008468 [Daldinia eschscholtzii]|uniref:Uncharacterized protein n=1 Tax=Daldinia eschscholtzii TaxID=292717 RepID=A0AAX6MD73_9PEZI